MSELISLSIREMRAGLLRGDFSASELTEAHLTRIEATNPQFNSFLRVTADDARIQAKNADALLRSEKTNAPALAGIPIAIKDMLVTKGVETTCASKILKGFIPPYDGTAVARLKERGAVLLGKTNLDEFAMGSSNENSAFGPVKNPWDISRVPGGSSGGSAAAVSLGQAPIALGTDTGGSIRQPAALCGIVGVKPTYGRVSRYGAVAFASSLDQIGPFGRDVYDTALVLEAISGVDDNDSTAMNLPVPAYAELTEQAPSSLKGLRIGIPREYFVSGMQKEVDQSVRAGIDRLKKLGADIVDISLPMSEHALSVYYILAPAEASSNLARYDGIRYGLREAAGSLSELYEKTRANGFGAEVKRRILIGSYVLSAGYYDAYYRKAQQVRTLLIEDFKKAFKSECDLIATPTSPVTAFKLGERTQSPLEMYLADVMTIPASLAGLPGLSMPCGVDSQNLPIGLQLIAPPFEEVKMLQTAYALEQELKFDSRKMTARKSW